MSQVDARFDAEERERLLREVRMHLPAFLSAAATQQYDPINDVRELLRLEEADLRRVVAVHLCLTKPVQDFLAALPQGLRRPVTSSTRPPVVTQAIRGPVDWGATVRVRALAAGDRSLFVARPARRIFDVPENRALAWLVSVLDKHLRRAAASAALVDEDDEEQRNWQQQLRAQRAGLAVFRRHPWTSEVAPERPTANTLRRLRASRTMFYGRTIPEALKAVMRYGEHPTEHELTELLTQRYFRPTEDWRLFEVTVALRLARAFADNSPVKRKARLLVGTGGAAYARYELVDGDEVRLHYQTWPAGMGRSLHAEARSRHKLRAGAPRPDILVRRVGASPDAAVLELKASESASYLGAGLTQLLGYLKERPDAWSANPRGWLVAPASDAFSSGSAAGEELWMVSADDVAQAAVARFAPEVTLSPTGPAGAKT